MEIEVINQDQVKLAKKLVEIRKKCFMGKDMTVALKNSSYAARSEEGVLTLVRPLLDEYGVDFFITKIDPFFHSSTAVKIVLHGIFMDIETGASLPAVSIGSGVDQGDKDTGKAITYAVKNLFVKRFLFISGDDNDKTSTEMDLIRAKQDYKNELNRLTSIKYFDRAFGPNAIETLNKWENFIEQATDLNSIYEKLNILKGLGK